MAQPMSRNVPSRCTGARISSLASRHNCESPSKPDCHRGSSSRSEEHTSELQSRSDLVCRLLLEKKKKKHKHEGWPAQRYSSVKHCETLNLSPITPGNHSQIPFMIWSHVAPHKSRSLAALIAST